MSDLSIVIVSWNVRDFLHRCLASIAQTATGAGCEVVVVDNASTDGSADMVRSDYPAATVIANTANLGFTRANNQAIARCRGRYVLLLNPDTEAVGNALQTMVSYMEAHPQVAVVGPQLVYADGSVQSSRRRFPTLKTMFVESTVLQGAFARSPIIKHYFVLDQPHDTVQEVDWLVGACLMVKRDVIDAVGLLDERFFMYSEEVDWCLRIKQKGWRVVYLPTAQVIHHEARSSDQVAAAKHMHFDASKVSYARKHFGPVQAEVLRLFLLSGYICQIMLEAGKWLAGHKRPLRAQRIAVYRQVLRSGLSEPGTQEREV